MRFFSTIILIFCGLVGVLLFSGCSNTKYLTGNEVLLKKNKIKISIPPSSPIKEIIRLRKDAEAANQLSQDLYSLCKQKENTKTINLLKANLWLYNKKDSIGEANAHFFVTKWWDGFRTFLGKHLGEPPVIYDSTLAFSSLQLMENYLNNKGYLHAKVNYSTIIKRKRATVAYTIKTGKLYRIDSIYYPPKGSTLGDLINGSLKNTLLHPGMSYDVDLMKQETDRITSDLNDSGYYHFIDSYMYFEVDTLTKPGVMTARLRLLKKPPDSLAYTRFTIDNIYVYPDTVVGVAPVSFNDTVSPEQHFYIVNGHGLLHPKVFLNAISISPGTWYSKYENDNTIERLADLNMFKFITVKYTETKDNRLDCYIYLIPAKREAVQAQYEIDNYTNNPIGNQVSLSYLDKNLFSGADQLNLIVSGGIQLNPADSTPGWINTVDFNSTLNLTFPKYIGPQVPKFIKNLFHSNAKKSRPNIKSIITVNYNYTQRLDYFTLQTATVSFGWDWHESKFVHFIINPLSISGLDIYNISNPFQILLDADPLLEKSYTPQRIIGGNYSFIWTNELVGTNQKKYSYFRATIDVAGNSFELANYIGNHFKFPDYPPNSYLAFGRPFAQFAKFDLEYRHYWKLFHRNYLVFRFAPGFGVAYGNTPGDMPYTEQFYLGGPNSLRGWQIRSLGPGSYVIPSTEQSALLYADQTADIKLEGNFEYRFDIFGPLKGAAFIDFGNIWDRVADPDRQGGAFEINETNGNAPFYKEIAADYGAGLRYDFGYFVVRLDLGIPEYNPATQKWLTTLRLFYGPWFSQYAVLNLAIGYPF